MPINPDEIKRRESSARAAIKKALVTADETSSVTLFVSHHLEEIGSSYWKKHLSTHSPSPQSILDLLVLRSHWGGKDEIDIFDFTLPDDITNYVISVVFDEAGKISEIGMES